MNSCSYAWFVYFFLKSSVARSIFVLRPCVESQKLISDELFNSMRILRYFWGEIMVWFQKVDLDVRWCFFPLTEGSDPFGKPRAWCLGNARTWHRSDSDSCRPFNFNHSVSLFSCPLLLLRMDRERGRGRGWPHLEDRGREAILAPPKQTTEKQNKEIASFPSCISYPLCLLSLSSIILVSLSSMPPSPTSGLGFLQHLSHSTNLQGDLLLMSDALLDDLVRRLNAARVTVQRSASSTPARPATPNAPRRSISLAHDDHEQVSPPYIHSSPPLHTGLPPSSIPHPSTPCLFPRPHGRPQPSVDSSPPAPMPAVFRLSPLHQLTLQRPQVWCMLSAGSLLRQYKRKSRRRRSKGRKSIQRTKRAMFSCQILVVNRCVGDGRGGGRGSSEHTEEGRRRLTYPYTSSRGFDHKVGHRLSCFWQLLARIRAHHHVASEWTRLQYLSQALMYRPKAWRLHYVHDDLQWVVRGDGQWWGEDGMSWYESWDCFFWRTDSTPRLRVELPVNIPDSLIVNLSLRLLLWDICISPTSSELAEWGLVRSVTSLEVPSARSVPLFEDAWGCFQAKHQTSKPIGDASPDHVMLDAAWGCSQPSRETSHARVHPRRIQAWTETIGTAKTWRPSIVCFVAAAIVQHCIHKVITTQSRTTIYYRSIMSGQCQRSWCTYSSLFLELFPTSSVIALSRNTGIVTSSQSERRSLFHHTGQYRCRLGSENWHLWHFIP